jgi:hypothetical protein
LTGWAAADSDAALEALDDSDGAALAEGADVVVELHAAKAIAAAATPERNFHRIIVRDSSSVNLVVRAFRATSTGTDFSAAVGCQSVGPLLSSTLASANHPFNPVSWIPSMNLRCAKK